MSVARETNTHGKSGSSRRNHASFEFTSDSTHDVLTTTNQMRCHCCVQTVFFAEVWKRSLWQCLTVDAVSDIDAFARCDLPERRRHTHTQHGPWTRHWKRTNANSSAMNGSNYRKHSANPGLAETMAASWRRLRSITGRSAARRPVARKPQDAQ